MDRVSLVEPRQTRVAVCGAHSSGKSELIKEVARRCPDTVVIGGIVRDLIDQGYRFGLETDEESMWLYATRQFAAEDSVQLQPVPLILSDRCLIDGYSYVTANQGVKGRVQWGEVSRNFLWSIARRQLLFYDLLVYVPIEFEMVPDGYRPSDKEYQRQVDIAMTGIIESDLPVKLLRVSGTIGQRADQLLSAIEMDF